MRSMAMPVIALAFLVGLVGTVGAARSADANRAVRRTLVEYDIPQIELTRDDGARVSLPKELADGRTVVVNFIYTTCTTICPLSSQVFELFQRRLGANRDLVHLVSISIDPEEDTPGQLKRYARQFHAGVGWQYYTGTTQASIAAQRAFAVYRGVKMNHTPVTLMRNAAGGPWVRLEGFATADDLYAEYRILVAAH